MPEESFKYSNGQNQDMKKARRKAKKKNTKKKQASPKGIIKARAAFIDRSHTLSLQSGRLQVKRKQVYKILQPKKQNALPSLGIGGTGPVSGKVSSGIPGLDGIMGGGFERGSSNVISGGAGSGKSIFCTQFLIDGIENKKENAIYVSFEEEKDKFFKHMKQFGWDLATYEKEKKLVFLRYTPLQVKKLLDEGGGAIETNITNIKAKRLVIDSLTAFTLLQKNELERREAVLDLLAMFSKWGITTLFTMEQEPDPEKHQSTVMEFEVDGVILLYNVRKGDIRQRSLEIFKLRSAKHSQKILPLKITDKGIIIYPGQVMY